MTQVFMLNMTYDVPVKVFSFHLLLLSMFLFAPEARRMAAFLWGDRSAGPSAQSELFWGRRANRIATVAQIVFGFWLVGLSAHIGFTVWKTYGSGRTLPPLYGIWNVDEVLIDGHVQLPLLTDSGRWQRLIVDSLPRINVQRMDDTFARYEAGINMKDKTITLSKSSDPSWRATLAFDPMAGDRMSLHGDMDKHRVHMQLHLVDRNRFLLVNRGFHWIQEVPFNR